MPINRPETTKTTRERLTRFAAAGIVGPVAMTGAMFFAPTSNASAAATPDLAPNLNVQQEKLHIREASKVAKIDAYSAAIDAAKAKEQAAQAAAEARAREEQARQRAAQAQQPASPTPSHATSARSADGALTTWLAKLRSCESGGDYQTNTGNSFYGAYQFTISTWNQYDTGYARADLAPPAIQDATIIENTKASSGGLSTQNPGCYHEEHLSKFPPAG